MDASQVEQLKKWIRFSGRDEEILRELSPLLKPYFAEIVNAFYRRLFEDPAAKAVFTGGEQQIAHLRVMLSRWLEEVFSGVYDESYYRRHSEIGRAHVRTDLPQRFMFSGMNIFREQLTTLIFKQFPKKAERRISAVNKILDLELAIILETYRESYIQKIRDADRLVMQRQLDGLQHMAEIGQLAASLAHEIKNPLAGISGAIQIISHEMDAENPHLEIMREILKQIDRLDYAVKDLLIYARPRALDLQHRQVGPVVRNSLSILRGDPALKSVQITQDVSDCPVKAMIDAGQLEHVISNIVLNAAQACTRGSGLIHIGLDVSDGEAVIEVRDNGVGMSPTILDRATEPFFTTKAKGSGLGLSICKKIIEAHQGRMEIDTQVNQGTTVRVLLPLLTDQIAPTGATAL